MTSGRRGWNCIAEPTLFKWAPDYDNQVLCVASRSNNIETSTTAGTAQYVSINGPSLPSAIAGILYIFVHGGQGAEGEEYNDLHKFERGQWLRIKTGGQAPSARSGHTGSGLKQAKEFRFSYHQ